MNQRGFILVATMVVLLLLTLLAIATSETSLLATKQAGVQWQFWRASAAARNANIAIANSLMKGDNVSCFVNYQIDNRYWSQPMTKWGDIKCGTHQMGVQTYSVIELLPDQYCFDEQVVIFMRVSTQVMTQQGVILHVQSVIAVPMFLHQSVQSAPFTHKAQEDLLYAQSAPLTRKVQEDLLYAQSAPLPPEAGEGLGERGLSGLPLPHSFKTSTCRKVFGKLSFGIQSWREG